MLQRLFTSVHKRIRLRKISRKPWMISRLPSSCHRKTRISVLCSRRSRKPRQMKRSHMPERCNRCLQVVEFTMKKKLPKILRHAVNCQNTRQKMYRLSSILRSATRVKKKKKVALSLRSSRSKYQKLQKTSDSCVQWSMVKVLATKTVFSIVLSRALWRRAVISRTAMVLVARVFMVKNSMMSRSGILIPPRVSSQWPIQAPIPTAPNSSSASDRHRILTKNTLSSEE